MPNAPWHWRQGDRIGEVCPYCGTASRLVDSTVVYGIGHGYGKMFVCGRFPACDTYVGCHRGTERPLGTLANKRLRALRKRCHVLFDALWQGKAKRERKRAYRWLGAALDLDEDRAHIAMLDEAQCAVLIDKCLALDGEVYASLPSGG